MLDRNFGQHEKGSIELFPGFDDDGDMLPYIDMYLELIRHASVLADKYNIVVQPGEEGDLEDTNLSNDARNEVEKYNVFLGQIRQYEATHNVNLLQYLEPYSQHAVDHSLDRSFLTQPDQEKLTIIDYFTR